MHGIAEQLGTGDGTEVKGGLRLRCKIWLVVPEAPTYCLVMSYRQLENN